MDTYVERVGNTSLVLRFDVLRDGELVTQVTNRYVWVDAASLRPTRPPDEIGEAFRANSA